MEKKDQKKNGNNPTDRMNKLETRLAEFEGRITERTKIYGDLIEQLRIEFAGRPWHKITSEVAALLGDAELRITDRMNRIELRLDNLREK